MNPYWTAGVAYLLGAIPFGVLIVKMRGGPDIRESGSGNIGAANVARNAGVVAGVVTLVLDAGKGYFAVWLAARVTHGNILWMTIAAAAAVIGHIFPVWLGFHGGKGVATGLGAFLPVCREAVLLALVLWVLVVGFWRYSSLGSIIATAAMPVFVYLLYAPGHAPPIDVTVCTVAISLLILWKHRANMRRLIAGKETRLITRR
ncbi:MAG TPA: glycerol-3-phosphate 1-O-acyltransferase PlsY [Candidatus Baltobacteraceae bacterium]|nr:glycerol-3-phosphate 1-O-acyltransferase PlsY [Candidatus Baltobacteraceae bacterium]